MESKVKIFSGTGSQYLAEKIAKKFGADESSTFVNGVLDKVAFHYRSEQKLIADGKLNIEIDNLNIDNDDLPNIFHAEKIVAKG